MASPSQVIYTEVIMKSKSNRRKLASVIGSFNRAEITPAKTDAGRFVLDEADMAIVLIWSEYDLLTYPTFVLGELGRHAVQGTDGALGWFSTWHQK